MKMDLQMFAEEEPENTEPEETTDAGAEEEPEKTHTDAEMNEVISRKQAEWKKKTDKAVAEARAEGEKVGRMSAEEKQKYDQEQAQKNYEEITARNAELEKELAQVSLSKQAQQIMKDDYGITATQEMLDFVVGDDEDSTKANIERFVAIINDDRKAQDKSRATGSTPKDYGGEKDKPSEIQKRIAKYKKEIKT